MPSSKIITRNDLINILAHINLGDNAHKEVTQAEFDALTPAQKNDGSIYFITDGISGSVFLDDNTPVGMIAPYGGTTDPAYWLICDGRAVSRTTYAELFAVIGTTYGTGDGSTTFNIPDLRGNVAVGASAIYDLGDSGGEATHTLNINEMPSHTHTMLYSGGSTTTWGYNYTSSGGTRSGQTEDSSGVGPTGGGQAHNNMQPYVVTNYIIKTSSTTSNHQTNIDFYYPVGAYYETSNASFNPNVTWGGTWELTNDYELVAWIVVNNSAVAASKNMTASGLGDTTYYNMSFTKPMKDTNYIVTVSGEASGVGCEIFGIYNKTTTNFYFDHANYSGTQVVVPIFQISVFGRLATPEHFKWHRTA